jgi:hypothetical protein
MGNWHIKMVLFQNCVWWSRPLTKMAAQHRTLWKIHIKTILSGTSSSIRTKHWWNSHWMVLFQNCVRQSRSPTKMAATVQLCCYWKQLWFRWAITGSLEPLVLFDYIWIVIGDSIVKKEYGYDPINWFMPCHIVIHGPNLDLVLCCGHFLYSMILVEELLYLLNC